MAERQTSYVKPVGSPANRPAPCHGERWWSACWYFMDDGPWYAICELRHRIDGNDPNYPRKKGTDD